MTPTETPVTGREPDGADDRLNALRDFYRAFNARDLAAMQAHWDSAADDIVMDNPLGGIMRGWDEIAGVYRKLFAGAVRVAVEFHDYSVAALGDGFVAIGRERGTLRAGDTTLDLAIRTSRLFRRVDGAWRQFHHHGSVDDPALLERYQSAIHR